MPMLTCRPARLLLAICLTGALCVVALPCAHAVSIKPHRSGKADQQAIIGIEDQIRSAIRR